MLLTNLIVQAEEKIQPTDLSLVLGGGVSLGAYGAGHLYQMFKFLNGQPNIKLRVVTGASAGAINGLISILDSCQELEQDPAKSINWLTWVPLGIRELGRIKAVTPLSIFDPKGASKSTELIKSRFSLGLKESCDVVFGIAVTRKDPQQIEVKSGVSFYRHQEFFAIRIKGLGKGVYPKIENFPLDLKDQHQLLLSFTNKFEHDYKELESVVTASSQFPLAFPPYELKFCDYSLDSKTACSQQNSQKAEFIDGGIFNNIPLDLAQSILKKLPNRNNSKKVLGVVTLDGLTYPAPTIKPDQNKSALPKIVDYTLSQIGAFVGTSRSATLQSFYLQRFDNKNIFLTNLKVLPGASRYYYAFSGFMDKDFRVYDFVLGQFEVDLFLKENHLTNANLSNYGTKNISEHLLSCFNEFFDKKGELPLICKSLVNENENLLKLLIVNSEIPRLRCLENSELEEKFWSCRHLKNFKFAPSISNSTDQDYFSKRLRDLNYQYELSNEKQKSLESLIRQEIQPLIKELSSQQNDKDESFLAELGQDLILDSLDFRPKNVINSIGLGSHLQLNRSYLLNPSSSNNLWYYAGGGVMLRNIDTYLTDKNDSLTFAPFVSFNLGWITEKQNWIQPDFGLRFGYNYSHRQSATACNNSVKWEPGSLCRSTFLQPTLSISFLKLIRFEIGNVYYTKNFSIKDATYLFQVSF